MWTDRGAARHAKILDTDEAWEVYEELEENYFNLKENKHNISLSNFGECIFMQKSCGYYKIKESNYIIKNVVTILFLIVTTMKF